MSVSEIQEQETQEAPEKVQDEGVTGGIGVGLPPLESEESEDSTPTTPSTKPIPLLQNKIQREVKQYQECLQIEITPCYSQQGGSAIASLPKGTILHSLELLEIEAFDNGFSVGDGLGNKDKFLSQGKNKLEKTMLIQERTNLCVYFDAEAKKGKVVLIAFYSLPTITYRDH